MSNIRTKGVQGNKSMETAPPQTLQAVAPVEFHAVMFGDAQGQQVKCLVLRVGDQWYMPPDSANYANELRPLAPWLDKQLTARVGSKVEELPKKDAVDVL